MVGLVHAPLSTYVTAQTYDIRICGTCGAGETNPVPTATDLDELYSNTYDYGEFTDNTNVCFYSCNLPWICCTRITDHFIKWNNRNMESCCC